MGKPAFCICENKDADQLLGDREADQRLCFRYRDCAIPLLSKSEISSLQPSSVAKQPSLCRTWSETPKTGFLTMRLIYSFCDQNFKICLCRCTGQSVPYLLRNSKRHVFMMLSLGVFDQFRLKSVLYSNTITCYSLEISDMETRGRLFKIKDNFS